MGKRRRCSSQTGNDRDERYEDETMCHSGEENEEEEEYYDDERVVTVDGCDDDVL